MTGDLLTRYRATPSLDFIARRALVWLKVLHVPQTVTVREAMATLFRVPRPRATTVLRDQPAATASDALQAGAATAALYPPVLAQRRRMSLLWGSLHRLS